MKEEDAGRKSTLGLTSCRMPSLHFTHSLAALTGEIVRWLGRVFLLSLYLYYTWLPRIGLSFQRSLSFHWLQSHRFWSEFFTQFRSAFVYKANGSHCIQRKCCRWVILWLDLHSSFSKLYIPFRAFPLSSLIRQISESHESLAHNWNGWHSSR